MRYAKTGPRPGGRFGRTARLLAIALVPAAVLAPPALAGGTGESIRFRVLEGSYGLQAHGTGASQGACYDGGVATSASASVNARTGRQEEPAGSVTVEPSGALSGSISAASTSGSGSESWNGCTGAFPPKSCSETATGEGFGSWDVAIKAAADASDAELEWATPPLALRVGSATCVLPPIVQTRPILLHSRIPLEQLLSGDPVTLSVAGGDTQNGGGPGATIGAAYSLSLKVQAIGVLSVSTSAARDVVEAGGRWPFSFDAAWSDETCASPPPGSPAPLAYAVIGADRARLRALLGAPQEGLARNAAFGPNAFRLGTRHNGRRISARSRSDGGASFEAAANALHVRGGRSMPAGNGVFYGGRIACRRSARARYKVARSAPRVLCRNRRRLSGTAWGGLTATMRARLEALYAALDSDQVCYALSSGYRSEKDQQKAYDEWHRRADRSNPADRGNRTLNQLCPGGEIGNGPMRGFLQCPSGWDRNGVAQNGPARPGSSRHEKGEAADLKLAFGALTGRFDPTDGERRADVRARFAAYVLRVPGLCPSPARDPGHIELPYSVPGRDARGNVVMDPPRCHFSDGAQASSAAWTHRAARPSARRRTGITAARALALAAGIGKRFVERSRTDSYLDWSAGSCRASRGGATCRLAVSGENGRRPFTCRTYVRIRKSGRRTIAAVLGRRTRCR